MDALGLTAQALINDFTESAKVYHFTTVEKLGIVKQEPMLLYENIPCGLNRWGNRMRRSGAGEFTASHQTITYGAVLYLPLEYAVLPGDVVAVTQLGQETSYEVLGVSSRYATHQELFLVERTLA